MAEVTGISWCDRTWLPWYGCTQVSMGPQGACEGCYARQMSETRFGRVVFGGPGRGEGTRDVRAHSAWKEPLKWQREAAEAERAWEDAGAEWVGPRPSTSIFPSMCDPFDNHPALREPRRRFFNLIRATPNLTWLLLTKRPGNIVKLFTEASQIGDPTGGRCVLVKSWPRNAAIGCTVVSQEEADRDIPKLLAAKAALNPAFAFLSMEPLLGPVDMKRWLPAGRLAKRALSDELFLAPHFYMTRCEHCGWVGSSELCGTDSFGDDSDVYCPACRRSISGDDYPALDWVITGGETDQGKHKARPTHPDWFRSIRDQCAAAGVPLHHKQNGEWAPCPTNDGGWWPADNPTHCRLEPNGERTYDGWPMQKVGKKHSGRLLDGVLHNAMPAVRP